MMMMIARKSVISRMCIGGLLVAFLLSVSAPTIVDAAQANPLPMPYEQPDSTATPPLVLNGNQEYAWLTDEDGYHVLRDEEGWYVYGQKVDGRMEPTGVRVGRKNPKKLGMVPWETDDQKSLLSSSISEQDKGRRRLRSNAALCNRLGTKNSPCRRRGLVVLVRFADHANRRLPTPREYDILFNNNGPAPNVAPTGSVFDVFRENSYGAYVYQNFVTDWVTVGQTEEYAAGDNLGLNVCGTKEAWLAALLQLKDQGINFRDFDSDGDGELDSLVFVHSGAGGEAGNADCETNRDWKQRIWSHQASGLGAVGDGMRAGLHYVASGVTHYCPLVGGRGHTWGIARIGVIAHEFGHFLHAPDLYDSSGGTRAGAGAGTFDLMGKSNNKLFAFFFEMSLMTRYLTTKQYEKQPTCGVGIPSQNGRSCCLP